MALDSRARPALSLPQDVMSGTTVGLITAGCIFSGALLGLALSKLLPGHHLNAESKDAVKVGAGMISMMAALVLGLLVSSAKSTFDSTSATITQGAAKLIIIDRLLANYGPEAKEVREELRRGAASAIQMLWPEEFSTNATPAVLETFERNPAMEKLLAGLRSLRPQTEVQRAILAQAQALANETLLSRWLQIEQAQITLPAPFLIILLFWLTLLYTSFGLLAPRNATVIVVMFLGALALATAVFLIVEMSHPMVGAMKVSSAPMRHALEQLRRQ